LISVDLIPDVDHEANGSGRLVADGGGAARAHGGTGGTSLELRGPTTSKLDFQWVFSYLIAAMWRTHFAHLGMVVGGVGGWRWRSLPFELE
jgi:hypothetical protein